MLTFPKYSVPLIFAAATVVYILGLFVNVMDVDAAQYASISREMLVNHQFLQVLHRGANYLDKPPLLFWLSALSFKLFGVSTFAFKLPTFLFTLLGVYSTFKTGAILYNRSAGIVAALLLYTSQAFFLFNNDVRTDALLTANVAFACWQLLEFSSSKKNVHLLLGFAGVALAMMAKGPIGAVVPAAALVTHLMFRREWRKLFWWQWYAGIAFAGLLLLPMLYGLYEQYGMEGPDFFLWTQSFGRITGQNVWHNDAGYFYFIHNFFWSFLPWAFIAVIALAALLYRLFANKFRQGAITETFSLGGFVLPFIALSFSHYKLPHYVFVVYPLCAVMTAGFIIERVVSSPKFFRTLGYVQLVVCILLLGGAIYLGSYIFPSGDIWLWTSILVLVGLCGYYFFKSGSLLGKLILPSAVAIIAVDLFLNAQVYPSLLKYQSGSELAAVAVREHVPKDGLYFYNYHSHAFEFYFQGIAGPISEEDIVRRTSAGEHFWIVGGADLLHIIRSHRINPEKIVATDDFAVTRLTVTFLNPETRPQELTQKYLVGL